MPSTQQISRINDVLYEIHRDIAAELSAQKLAKIAAYSEQHFHRTFHKVVGEPVHQYVRRTRLEHAANQLMFDANRSIIDIAAKCGFVSLSSFGKAFKATFAVTPGQWRALEQSTELPPYLQDLEIAAGFDRIQACPLPVVDFIELPDQAVAYVRHQGYGRSIRQAWQKLQVWAAAQGRPCVDQIGLHHSNPAWVPLDQCRYVACMAIDEPVLKRGLVNSLTIPGGLHASFRLTGKYGELLPYISKVLMQWLPDSGFRARTTPAFVRYHKNHFLRADERFDVTFYLPISPW